MKNFTLLCIVVLVNSCLLAQVEGPRNATVTVGSSFSTSAPLWIDPNNTFISDNVYSNFGNISGGIGSSTSLLTVKGFGFAVPAGATIKGIKVDVERSDPSMATADHSIRLLKNSNPSGSNRSTGIAYPAADAYQSYGGTTDLWGETWTVNDINSPDFGVAISAQRNTETGTTRGRVDDIMITVYWGFVTLPLNLVSFTAQKENNKVNINWNTSSESNMAHFEVERSSDGQVFYPLTTIPSLNRAIASYSFRDEHPVAGTSYYRLKMQENTGEKNYSKIVSVQFAKYTTIRLSPSPWTRGTDLLISNPAKELLTIQFYDAAGAVIGKTATTTSQVVMPVLTSTKGVIYYKVSGKNNQLKGTGTLLIN